MTKKSKYKKLKQMRLRNAFFKTLILHILITVVIMATSAVNTSENNKIEGEDKIVVHESATEANKDEHDATTPPATVLPDTQLEESEPIEMIFDRGLSNNDKYLLAKIAMTEAEGESIETKIKIIMVVLNRVESEVFPDTIESVIFQKSNDTYQFSPIMPGGRWWTTEPNEECWEAVELVNRMPDDPSFGALYFEACKGESWHSRNLTFICKSDNTRFYK